MEFKHRAAGHDAAGDLPARGPMPSSIPLTVTSGPSLPQRPLPRPSVQEAEHVVCSYPAALQPPPQVLVGGNAPVVAAVLPPMPPPALLALLSRLFGRPCPDSRPETLQGLAALAATGLDATGIDGFVERIVVPCSGCLSSGRLTAVVAGLWSALPDGEHRQRARDRIGQALLTPSRGWRPGDIARLTVAAVGAWGGSEMAWHDAEAFSRWLVTATDELAPEQVGEIIQGLCFGMGGTGMAPFLVQALVWSLCEGAGSLEEPRMARALLRQLAQSLGGQAMDMPMRHFLVDLLVDAPSLDPAQLGEMLIGLAQALAGMAPCVADGKAASPTTQGVPSCLGFVIAFSQELSQPQLVRWGLGVGAALRPDGQAGIRALGDAMYDGATAFSEEQLIALGCGIAAGLADGFLGAGSLDLLVHLANLGHARKQRAFELGLRLPQDPLEATEGQADRDELLDLPWQLPQVLNARTAPAWFERILDAKGAPAERAATLVRLAHHGAQHLPVARLRQARDLAMAHAPDLMSSLYGAWMECGLPEALFDQELPLPPDLSVHRHALAQRLEQAEQELADLSGCPCEPGTRLRLRALLTHLRDALRSGLEAARAQAKALVSAPAGR